MSMVMAFAYIRPDGKIILGRLWFLGVGDDIHILQGFFITN